MLRQQVERGDHLYPGSSGPQAPTPCLTRLSHFPESQPPVWVRRYPPETGAAPEFQAGDLPDDLRLEMWIMLSRAPEFVRSDWWD